MKKNKISLKKAITLFLIVVFCLVDFYPLYGLRAENIGDLQDAMSSTQKKIEQEQKDLAASKSIYNKVTAQVGATKSLVEQTASEISRKEAEIKNLDDQVNLNKKVLAVYLQEMYFSDQDPVINLAIANESLDAVFGNEEQMLNIKEKILRVLDEIDASQNKLAITADELADEKEKHEKLLQQKKIEQGAVAADIQDSQATIADLNSKLNKLRSQYSSALGKTVSTDDIVKAAKFAAGATGMNKSFLLGVLIQESNKGQNVGGCDYKSSRMTSTQLVAFKSICKELDYDYRKQPVSCPPSSYKGTGGAMGVPQFMPTTWQGYKSIIASYSGHSTPDPWNLVDGVVAMASKLSNDGASKKTRFAEAKSYCVYLAGGNWGYYCFGSDKYKDSYEDVNCWGSSIRNYGEKVLCLKDNYEKYYN